MTDENIIPAMRRIAGEVEYADPAAGPIRRFPSEEAAKAWNKHVDDAIRLLLDEGYQVLDFHGRALARPAS